MIDALHATAQTIVGIFLIVDRDAVIWVSVIMALLTIAGLALLGRKRKWPELVCLFVIFFVLAMSIAHVFFKYVVDYPIMKAEPISMTTD